MAQNGSSSYCLTLPGFPFSLSVFSIVVTIFHAYQLHTVLFLCCTGGVVGAVGVYSVAIFCTRKWFMVWKGKTCEKLSVLCSADSEDDPGNEKSSSLTNDDMDNSCFIQHGGFRFGADTYGHHTKATRLPLQSLELKNLDASENSKRLNELLSKAAEHNFDVIRKQPEEHVDVSCIALQKNINIKWDGTSEMSLDSSCAESDVQQTSGNKPNPQGGQSCHGNNKQSCCGEPANRGNHGKQKHGSCGASSRDDDEDRDDRQKRKPVEIPHGCQTNSSVDVTTVKEETPADTSHDDTSQEQETDTSQDGTPYQEGVDQEVGAKGSLEAIHALQELENMNQILIATFQHQRYFGSRASRCTESACHEIQDLISHCADCPLNVLGGCLDCMEYCHLLLYHVAQCHGPRCTHRCHFIKSHIQVHGAPDVSQWTLGLDKLFFKPLSPDSPTSGITAAQTVEPRLLFSEAKEIMATEEAPRIARSVLGESVVIADYILSCDPPQCAGGPPNRGSNDTEWSRILVRGPLLTAAKSKLEEEGEPVLSKTPEPARLLSTGHATQDASYNPRQRPKEQVVHWRLNKEKLSVTEDGRYDENFEWLQQSYVGGGRNGQCFQCIDNKTGFLFAIKKIRMSKFEVQELEVWASLSGNHPNIVELFGAVQTNGYAIIFMEFMKGGSVCEHLDVDDPLNELQALHILQQTMSAIDFMHSLMILHRDIKGENVLLDEYGRVKVADFGTALKLTNTEFQQDKLPCGTEAFMAPEVCRSEGHSFSADVWSLMCLLYQLLTGEPPWQQHVHCSLLYKIGTAMEPPPLPPECSAAVVDFFQRGFIIKASERATVRELLHHDVFQPGAGVSYVSCEECTSDANSLLNDHNSGDSCGMQQACACAEPLPPDEQLSSLQSELLLSLSLQDGDTSNFFSAASDHTEAVEDFDPTELLAQLMSREPDVTESTVLDSSSAPTQDGSRDGAYSMRDLTKVHILNPSGDYMFMVRHNPSVTYGTLAEQLHWSVASLTGLAFFTLTLPEGLQLCVWAAIGSEEQRLKVEPAYDADSWRGWRIDQHGLLEQRPCAD